MARSRLYCTDCGKGLRPSANSCPRCGASMPESLGTRAKGFGNEFAFNVVVEGALKAIAAIF